MSNQTDKKKQQLPILSVNEFGLKLHNIVDKLKKVRALDRLVRSKNGKAKLTYPDENTNKEVTRELTKGDIDGYYAAINHELNMLQRYYFVSRKEENRKNDSVQKYLDEIDTLISDARNERETLEEITDRVKQFREDSPLIITKSGRGSSGTAAASYIKGTELHEALKYIIDDLGLETSFYNTVYKDGIVNKTIVMGLIKYYLAQKRGSVANKWSADGTRIAFDKELRRKLKRTIDTFNEANVENNKGKVKKIDPTRFAPIADTNALLVPNKLFKVVPPTEDEIPVWATENETKTYIKNRQDYELLLAANPDVGDGVIPEKDIGKVYGRSDAKTKTSGELEKIQKELSVLNARNPADEAAFKAGKAKFNTLLNAARLNAAAENVLADAKLEENSKLRSAINKSANKNFKRRDFNDESRQKSVIRAIKSYLKTKSGKSRYYDKAQKEALAKELRADKDFIADISARADEAEAKKAAEVEKATAAESKKSRRSKK